MPQAHNPARDGKKQLMREFRVGGKTLKRLQKRARRTAKAYAQVVSKGPVFDGDKLHNVSIKQV